MARKKLTRRELVQKDEITSTLQDVTTFVVEHRKPVSAVAAVVVVAVVLLIGWNVIAANREASSQSALSEVIQTYTDTELTEDEERFQATLTKAQLVQEEYPNQDTARVAQFYAALSHQGLGNNAEAVQLLEGLLDSGDETVQEIARYALAESYKNSGELERAITVYQELADSGGYSEGAVQYELGRLHETMDSLDEAREHYESLVAEFPDSPFRADADRALSRLPGGGEESGEDSGEESGEESEDAS